MTYGEAIRLVTVLARDPSSALAAELAGWVHPVSRGTAVLADVWDLLAIANSPKGKRPKPYPRTWVPDANRRRVGRTRLSPDQARDVLAAARDGRVRPSSAASALT